MLCYLEGLTHDEAAARLGWPVGTIHGRLTRARDRLRARLTRRGVVPSFGVDQALAFIHIDKNVLPEALRRTTVTLLDSAVPRRLQSLIKGALFNMFIEKLRLAAATVLVTVIGVATATTVLFAFQGPGNTASEPKADAAENAISQKVPTSSLTTAQPKLVPTVASTKVDNEEAASGLEELRVEAELLEITIETEKATIKNLAGFLDGVAEQIDEIESMRSQQTKDQQEKLDERRANTMRIIYSRLKNKQGEYRDHRMKLAALHARIARESKALNESDQSLPNASAPDRRIDRLEEKLDRIIRVFVGSRETLRNSKAIGCSWRSSSFVLGRGSVHSSQSRRRPQIVLSSGAGTSDCSDHSRTTSAICGDLGHRADADVAAGQALGLRRDQDDLAARAARRRPGPRRASSRSGTGPRRDPRATGGGGAGSPGCPTSACSSPGPG